MKAFFKIFTLLASGLLLIPACNDTEEEEHQRKLDQEKRYFDLYMGSTFGDTIDPPTESGLYHIVFEEGRGVQVEDTSWLIVNYVCSAIPGDRVVDTYLENVATDNGLYSEVPIYGPFKMQNGSRTAGLQEGLNLMRQGGKSIICFTSELGYGTNGTDLMVNIPGYQSLKYEVEVLEVIDDIIAYEFDKMEAYVDTIEGADTIYDVYADSYMYYVIDEPNNGSIIKDDSVVEIAYKGYLTDGRVFDESAEDEPYQFKVGDFSDDRSPIPGWHDGVTRFREGEKGRLIIPYTLAYQEAGHVINGVVSIPPYETLVFDIEIVSVNGNNDDVKDEVN